jgi:transposase InsO family protein
MTQWPADQVERLHGSRFDTWQLAQDEVIDWINFYNHRRMHSTLGYVSSMAFEKNWFANQEKQAA